MAVPATVRAAGATLFACLAIGSGCRPSPPPAALTDRAAAAVRDTLIALDRAMNDAVDSTNCDRGLSFIGDEQPLFVSSGRVVATHADLLRLCRAMVAPRAGASFAVSSVAAHALSPDAGYVVREGEYTVRMKDGTSRSHHLVMTTIWSRQGGTWKMVHLHESAPPP